jgi:ketosteroid isomerase-like protein
MTNGDRAAVLDAFTAAWTAGDLDTLMSLMADDCSFRASVGPEPGATFAGRDEVRRGFELFLAPASSGPAPETEAEPTVISGDLAVTRWTSRHPQPDGPPVVVRACDILQFEGDRIKFKDTYRKVAGDLPTR